LENIPRYLRLREYLKATDPGKQFTHKQVLETQTFLSNGSQNAEDNSQTLGVKNEEEETSMTQTKESELELADLDLSGLSNPRTQYLGCMVSINPIKDVKVSLDVTKKDKGSEDFSLTALCVECSTNADSEFCLELLSTLAGAGLITNRDVILIAADNNGASLISNSPEPFIIKLEGIQNFVYSVVYA
jgi:hypothetical protein